MRRCNGGFTPIPGRHAPNTKSLVGGFTLTEVLITVVILAIVAAAAVANYGVTVQRARFDAARAVLVKIFEGEKFYYSTLSAAGAFTATPASAQLWLNDLQMDIPNNANVTYTITQPGGAGTFTATATFVGPGTTQTIDQARTLVPVVPGACAAPTWCRP